MQGSRTCQIGSFNEQEKTTTLHGVFMEISGIGLLLQGHSGIGKSELALELISRGHRLVADDAPILTKTSSNTITGSSPSLLQDFMEVQGLGILNIRAMFGSNAIKTTKILHLLIQLIPQEAITIENTRRLEGEISEDHVLGIPISVIALPIASGRNLAVLVEAAAKNRLLQLNGYNAAVELQARLNQQLNTSAK
jgi:HPr kinase/phosphorylase